MKFIRANLILFAALLTFFALAIPFLKTLPMLDGNIQFVMSYDFFSGGLPKYFRSWESAHPPLKFLVTDLFYFVFGIKTFIYNLSGILFLIVGDIAFYFLSKKLFDKKTAELSVILFALCGLSFAVGYFFVLDSLLTTVIILALLFLSRRNLVLYSVFSSFAVLTKETGIVFPLSVIFAFAIVWTGKFFRKGLSKKDIFALPYIAIPLIVYQIWNLTLASYGKSSWNDWNFSPTAKEGGIYTVINNLFSLQIFNKYAMEQWLHLFFLNFNWVFWLTFIFLTVVFLLKKKSVLYKNFDSGNSITILSIITFFLSYSLLALSFQTYTIPRYILPLLPFLYLGVATISVKVFKGKNLKLSILMIFLVLVQLVSLFKSIDPVSISLWGTEKVLGENIYGLRNHLDGNDGITYNLEYLFIASKRSNAILRASNKGQSVVSNNCYWVFPDPNNDSKMIEILNLNINLNCINTDGKL